MKKPIEHKAPPRSSGEKRKRIVKSNTHENDSSPYKNKESSDFKSKSFERPKRTFDKDSTSDKPSYGDKKHSDSPRSSRFSKDGDKLYSSRSSDKPRYEDKKFSDNPRTSRFPKDGDKPYSSRSSEKPSYGDKKFSDNPRTSRFSKDNDKPFSKDISGSDGEKASFRKERSFKPREQSGYENKYDNKQSDKPRTDRNDRGKFDGDKQSSKHYPESRPFGVKEGKSESHGESRFRYGKVERTERFDKRSNTNTLDGIRLNRYLANAGICSRREADELIVAGVVSINGNVVTELGTKVLPSDIVQYNGETLSGERKVYILLNKSKGYISTVDDPQERNTVMDLIKGACKERIYPVGRLDRATTGLLLMTNDGELTKKLTHPKYGVRKVYHVVLDNPLTRNDFRTIEQGVDIEGDIVSVDAIAYIKEDIDKRELGIELHSGKNRVVRRIFESLGYNVTKLDRVTFAGLTKKDLPRGTWRFLTPQEINYLNMV